MDFTSLGYSIPMVSQELPMGFGTPATTLVQAVRQALKPHVAMTRLAVDQAAALCHQSKRALQRQLAAQGPSLIPVTNDLKSETAIEALIESDQSVARIAASLGFADPTSFARSFKRWARQSPHGYRERRQLHLSTENTRCLGHQFSP